MAGYIAENMPFGVPGGAPAWEAADAKVVQLREEVVAEMKRATGWSPDWDERVYRDAAHFANQAGQMLQKARRNGAVVVALDEAIPVTPPPSASAPSPVDPLRQPHLAPAAGMSTDLDR